MFAPALLPMLHEAAFNSSVPSAAVMLRDVIRTIGLAVLCLSVVGLGVHYIFFRQARVETEPSERKPSGQELERYARPTRILHWVHGGAFCLLLLTGLVIYLAPGGNPSPNIISLIHRAAAIIFIAAPLVYLPLNWKAAPGGIKEAFTWEEDDIRWLLAIPQYYYTRQEDVLPPQGHLNPVQKLWWFVVMVMGAVLVISGAIMWASPPGSALFQWLAVAHDIAFIVTASMFLLHIYLAVMNPLAYHGRSESWQAMTRGRVSAEYARAHYRKWYEEASPGRDKPR